MKTRRWTWLALGACVLGHLGLTLAGCSGSGPLRHVADESQMAQAKLAVDPQFRDAMLRVRELQRQQKYAEAQQIVENEVLSVDPNNQAGLMIRDVLHDTQVFLNYSAGSDLKYRDLAELRMGIFVASIPPVVSESSVGFDPMVDYSLIPGDFFDSSGRRKMSSDPNAVIGGQSDNLGLAGVLLDDEVWVIQRHAGEPNPFENPTCGTLITVAPGQSTPVAIPLKHTDVQASITGPLSAVQVTQQFHNPYDSKIEASYVFPLPEDAAVSEFVMVIGDRQIRGIVREREEAQQIYAAARAQGHTASLLTQERPNIFTQKVANIEPGKAIDIQITYLGPLDYIDGGFEFVFPMVVGPRFNPAGTTDGVGAAPRGQGGVSGQSTEVQYLRPTERSGHDIAVNVTIDAGVEIEAIKSGSHVIETKRTSPSTATVALAALDRVPNKDFVLRVEVAGDTIKSGVIACRDERGGFFSMLIVPPKDLASLARGPVEMVYVLDASGSMNGTPIAQAKGAITRSLQTLQPGDTFQLINFASSTSVFGSYPVEANAANIRRAVQHLDQIQGEGGTHMLPGVRAALGFPHDSERLRFVVFLTDGFIGNEGDILKAVHKERATSRIFSFGVGSSPNRWLMDAMAALGNGFVNYLSHTDSSQQVMDDFMQRIAHAALHDVQLDFSHARVSEVYPSVIPDVFIGRPVMVFGRFEGELPDEVTIRGRAGGKAVTLSAPVTKVHEGLASRALVPVWARAKITELSLRGLWQGDADAPAAIRQVALDYGLMSAHTAFVAVDSSRRTEGDFGTTVIVPVPVPEGVRYETTVPAASVSGAGG